MHGWAPKFLCTSVLLPALAWAGDQPPQVSRVAALELEASLARQPVVYLVLDVGRLVLEVRSRTLVLDSVAVQGVAVVRHRPLLGGPEPSDPQVLPALWRVVSGPRDTDRQVIAPETLRPAPKDGEEEEEEATAGGGPSPTPTPVPEPPRSYRAQLDTGWELLVTQRLPARGWGHRFLEAARDGWARLRGRRETVPPAVAVVIDAQDARRLYHLIRSGTAILVTTDFP